MDTANLLQELEVVGLRAYPLNKQIGSVECVVKLIAQTHCSDILA